MKPRNQRLHDALAKFTTEVLKELDVNELEPLMKQFPRGLAAQYSQMLITSIRRNCLDEFEAILTETNLVEKLDQLDDLIVRSSGFDVSMAAFEFHRADPEAVKQTILNRAKQNEIDRLRKIVEQFREENGKLEARESEARERLRRAKAQIDEARRLLAV
jgi:hypothetical protein